MGSFVERKERCIMSTKITSDILESYTDEQYQEICRRALKVEVKTKFMLSQFEKSALKDAIKGDFVAGLMAESLFDLVYGEEDFEKRFVEFATDLALLPK
jgi:hypothetical protein